jgi:hypothetical protein
MWDGKPGIGKVRGREFESYAPHKCVLRVWTFSIFEIPTGTNRILWPGTYRLFSSSVLFPAIYVFSGQARVLFRGILLLICLSYPRSTPLFGWRVFFISFISIVLVIQVIIVTSVHFLTKFAMCSLVLIYLPFPRLMVCLDSWKKFCIYYATTLWNLQIYIKNEWHCIDT